MSRQFSFRPVALLLAAILALAACESAEDRAERHFASALSLLEEGDDLRAMVELRNVFRHNGLHEEARRTYAEVLMARGEEVEAMRNYRRLIEHAPDLVDVRQILAEHALGTGDWDEVRRHGNAAIELAPEDPRSEVIALALAYHEAVTARDRRGRATLASQAAQMLDLQPDNIILHRIMIDEQVSGDDPMRALATVEAALALDPQDPRLHDVKLRLLRLAGDPQAVTAQMEVMVAQFPENDTFQQELLRWHLTRGDLDAAEAFARAQAGPLDGPTDGHLAVVDLLRQIRGADVARDALNELIAVNAEADHVGTYKAFLALMDFQEGREAEAIATMEALLEEAPPSAQTRDLMSNLARMYNATGRQAQARTLIDTILAQDNSHVDALLVRAGWALMDGHVRAAITDLRTAQGQAPRNPQVMNMLATAFEREGNLELAGEQLANALSASGRAPQEALRYTRFLRQQGRSAAAERVLNDARAANPGNVALLLEQADLLLARSAWAEAREIARALRANEDARLDQIAQQIEAAVLLGQNQIDEGVSILQRLAASSDAKVRSVATVLAVQLRAGQSETARTYLAEQIEANPDMLGLLLLRANMEAVLGNAAEAEQDLRAILDADPAADNAARMLFGLLRGQGRDEEARAMLLSALDATPESLLLLWLLAQDHETHGEFDAAISVYEQIHALDPDNIVWINNLASMLTTYRDDPESLERAQMLATRLRGSDVPAFQDTYGWIAYRRGDLDTALDYLQRARRGLPDEPLVQFHLGMVLADLNRPEDARAALERAIELGEGRGLPQLHLAQTRLEALTEAAREQTGN